MPRRTLKHCLSGVNLLTLQITAQIKTQKNTGGVREITPLTPAPACAFSCAFHTSYFTLSFGTHNWCATFFCLVEWRGEKGRTAGCKRSQGKRDGLGDLKQLGVIKRNTRL